MVAAIIFGFLVGSVLSWGFRVWILMPVTMMTIIGVTIVQSFSGAGFRTGLEHCLLIGLSPQFGYAFGLLVRGVTAAIRSPRKAGAGVLGDQQFGQRVLIRFIYALSSQAILSLAAQYLLWGLASVRACAIMKHRG